jgi:tetratricopeptide (TPR) repeat protein
MPSSRTLLAVVSWLLVLLPTHALLANPVEANALLQQGRVDDAAVSLHPILAAEPADSRSHQLLCRIYYAQDMIDTAIHECELAVSNKPDDSNNQMWLGRAYGIKASRANPLTALSLAKKAHNSFERAVQLDPGNIRAISDLGEYYVAAPAVVGGGFDKAQALAATVMPRFPAQAHRILALLDEKKKDDAAAESEFKAAVAADSTPDTYNDLGQFYQRHNQSIKMLEALHTAIVLDHRKDAALVDSASILTAAHGSRDLAEKLLRDYLASAAKSDDAPAFKVHVQLGKLLAQSGDLAGAHREYLAALSLASNYAPARKAMQGS